MFRGDGDQSSSQGWSPLQGHTCGKASHPCLRNIVSFKKIPGRQTFKKVGRAIQETMSTTYPGEFSLCDLSRARGEIFERFSEQEPRPSPDRPVTIRVLDVVLL